MNLPQDPSRRSYARAALITAVCVLTATNAAAAVFVLSVVMKRPAALAPGERVPPGADTNAGDSRRVLLLFGEDSVEDAWAFATARLIDDERFSMVGIAPRTSNTTQMAPAPDALRRWFRKKLPVLPALVFVEEDGRIAETHLPPFAPDDFAARSLRFLDEEAPPAQAGPAGADTATPFLADALDGPAALREAARDPAIVEFLGHFSNRTIARAASLRFEEGRGYTWNVEFRAAPCGCSAKSEPITARVVLRPLDGAVLARDILGAAAQGHSGIAPSALDRAP